MKKIVVAIIASLLCLNMTAQGYVPTEECLKARQEFNRERFGIFIHWGIYSMLADGEWVQNRKDINYEEYALLANAFYPSKFNADEWAELFREAGAGYVTFTSRHHDGFSMFKTATSDYNIVDGTPFGRDVVKELADALAKNDIKLHFYYSHLDWHRLDYWPLGREGHGVGRPEGKDGDWQSYLEFMRTQLTELLTNYGPIGAIWFDGYWDKKNDFSYEELYDVWDLEAEYSLIHKLQPSCLVANNHHVSPYPGEDIQPFERDVPGENTSGYLTGTKVSSLPLETCQTLNKDWGYKIVGSPYKTIKELITLLARTASKGANLLLNVGPRPDGSIPDQSAALLREMGAWLKVNGESIYGTVAGCVPESEWGVSTQNGNCLYLHVLKGTDRIELPCTDNRLVGVVSLQDGAAVKFSQKKKTGIVIDVPAFDNSCPDYVLKLVFKKNL